MTKTLSKDDIFEIISMFPTSSTQTVAKHFKITVQYVNYIRRKYNAIPEKVYEELKVDYEKQDICSHSRIYFHCHDCKLSLSENDPLKIIEHMHRHLEAFPIRKLIEAKV